MDSKLLHVVTCVYNPIRWESRIKHFRSFREHMLDSGVRLTVVECALGNRPLVLSDDAHAEHIGVRADTLAWNKENLLNIAVTRSKTRTPYIAWIDADVEFRNKNWASDTVHALQQYQVVQPWGEALDLGPRNEPMMVNGFHVQTSFAKVWHFTDDICAKAAGTPGPYAAGWAYPHPGYAWAIRRDTLSNIGGFLEASGLGAGDHQMAMAFIGKFERAIHGKTNNQYQDTILAWGKRAFTFVKGSLGFVEGTIEHQFHGAKALRKYQDRWQILIDNDFNPVTDLKRNLDGVLELAGNKPSMERAFDRYYRQRAEDANILLED